jgi:ABC-type glutathione transport system ATPase component
MMAGVPACNPLSTGWWTAEAAGRPVRPAPTASTLDDMSDETATHVRGLRKSYGEVLAVDGIDLGINRGEVFALLGPNGAGKTTT